MSRLSRTAASRLVGVVTLAWLACFAFLTLSPELPDVPGLSAHGRVMNAGHLVASLVLGALVYLWIVTSRPEVETRPAAQMAAGATWGFGLLIEVVQAPIPHRAPEVGDAALDLLGALLGVGALVALTRPVLGRPAMPVITAMVGAALVASTAGVAVFGSTDTAAEIRCPGSVAGDELPATDGATRGRSPGRGNDGLVAEYDLAGDTGDEPALGAADAPPLVARGDVEQLAPRGVRFAGDDAVLRTEGAGPDLADAVDDAFTVETWARPRRLDQSGPARIVSSSDGVTLGDVDVQLGQERHCLSVRVNAGGERATWRLVRHVFDRPAPAWHLVVTYDRGDLRAYVDGERVLRRRIEKATLDGWDPDHPLLVGNEATRDRPFAGEVYLVAVYDRALSPREVARNHNAGF